MFQYTMDQLKYIIKTTQDEKVRCFALAELKRRVAVSIKRVKYG